MAGAAAEQQARLAEVSRLVNAHAARKAADVVEARQRTAALQAQLTDLAKCAGTAMVATAAASEAGLHVRAFRMTEYVAQAGTSMSYARCLRWMSGQAANTNQRPS